MDEIEEGDLEKQATFGLEETLRREPTPPPSDKFQVSSPVPSDICKEESPSTQSPEPPEVTVARGRSEQRLNQYILVNQVGRGGMGTVWKAWDTKLWRMVAIKFLSDADPQGIRRFQREAQVAAQLRHPNITTVFEVNESHGKHFIAMEFIDGTSMDKADLPFRGMLQVFVQVCRAVDTAHQAGVIHRDLKPANIMVTKDGKPYVTDFGLAKLVRIESSLSQSGTVIGTPNYMAPEQACGDLNQIDQKSDVYSLGATLYHLCVGQPPFAGESLSSVLLRVLSMEPSRPRKLKPDLSSEAEAIILQAMAKERNVRYPTAGALADDLQRYLDQQAVQARPPTRLGRILRGVARRPYMAIAAVLLASLSALWAAVTFSRKTEPSASRPIEKTLPTDPEKESWKRFQSLQVELSYYRFQIIVPSTVQEAKELLAVLTAPQRERAARWFQEEIAHAPPSDWPKKEWGAKREEARRIVAWSSTMEEILSGAAGDDFAAARGDFEELRKRFLKVTEYRGSFSLKIYTYPPSEVRDLRIGERWLIREGKSQGRGENGPIFTPEVFEDLDVADLSVTLRNPDGGEKSVQVTANELENGKTYLISGRFERPETIRLRAP